MRDVFVKTRFSSLLSTRQLGNATAGVLWTDNAFGAGPDAEKSPCAMFYVNVNAVLLNLVK